MIAKKIQVTVDGVNYSATYNVGITNTVGGFTSQDAFYNIYLGNEIAIERAAAKALESEQKYATGERPGKTAGLNVSVRFID